MKKMNNKGFTLMEMLIVVAIIAVLVAIAIPVFTNQLEKAREATDMANIRSAYAEVMATALTDTDRSSDAETDVGNGVKRTVTNGVATWTKTVAAVQKQAGWQSGQPEIGGNKDVKAVTSGSSWTVSYTEGAASANATITPTNNNG